MRSTRSIIYAHATSAPDVKFQFYSGFFRNWDNAAQVVPTVDPWLNFWVLNQSDATLDQYILIREDLDGNGWTDGAMNILNGTVTGNSAPSGTAGGLFVAIFGRSAAALTLQNSIVAANGDFGCFASCFGAGAVTLESLGNNIYTDGTCAPTGTVQIVGDALLGPLGDNGSSTWTHALQPGSPAIDNVVAACPATDQRGVARPKGAGCDAGSFELE